MPFERRDVEVRWGHVPLCEGGGGRRHPGRRRSAFVLLYRVSATFILLHRARSMTSLFPGQFPGAAGGASAPALTLKWGKCFLADLDGGKKFKVTPDKRKGALTLGRKGTDGMHHLKWKDRATQSQEEDLFIFPGEQTVEKVETGRPDDRVYLLQFKNGKRLFFWSQEFDVEEETKKVEELGKYLKDPSTIPAAPAAANPNPMAGGGQDQLRALLGGLGGGASPPMGGGAGGISEDDLRNILSGMGGGAPSQPPPAAPQQSAQPPPAPGASPSGNTIGEFQEDEMLRLAIEASMREAQPPAGGEDAGGEDDDMEGDGNDGTDNASA